VLLLPTRVSGDALSSPKGGKLKVLVPLDGSPSAEAILPVIVRLGASLPLSATVLHVVPPLGAPSQPLPDGSDAYAAMAALAAPYLGRRHLSWATAATYCRRVADWLERYGVPARVEIRAGVAIEEIGRAALDLAQAQGGVLALGLPDALPWRFGYSAEPLLRAVPLPVLQIRSRRSEPVVPPNETVGTAAGDGVSLASVAGEWDHRAHAGTAPRSRL
jgi:nucleotide-binding universal stress UspA family protein